VFVAGGDEPEQQLAAGAVQRGEPDFVADDEVVAEQGFDDLPDAVVREAVVEGLDELGGGEVPDPQALFDGGVPEGDQGVALAGPGWPDQGQILPRADPLQRGEVGPGRRADAARGEVELIDRLGGREAGLFAAQPGVAGVAGGDLDLDQRPQQLLGGPALGLRGDEQLRATRRMLASLSRRSPCSRSADSGAGVLAVIRPPRSGRRACSPRESAMQWSAARSPTPRRGQWAARPPRRRPGSTGRHWPATGRT